MEENKKAWEQIAHHTKIAREAMYKKNNVHSGAKPFVVLSATELAKKL